MKFSQKHGIAAGSIAVIAALLALKGAVAQYGPSGGAAGSAGMQNGANAVAVANEVDQHIHSIALTSADVATLLGSLGQNGSITFESSTGYDGGAPNGRAHTHTVTLTYADLQRLQNTGTVTVRSSEALNHTHDFRFIVPAQCPGVMPVPPSPSPSPSPSISPSPSPSPSVSPSASPSVSPSPSTSPSTQPSGSPSPQGGTTGIPIPLPSLTLIPIPR